jgi:hypothetical protein
MPTLKDAIITTMGKQGKFPLPGDREVATAVRTAERKIAEGECLKLAIAHAVGQAELGVSRARLVRRVS